MTQGINTPLCMHCSDPLDADGRDLITGETFCGANPDHDHHESDQQPTCPGRRMLESGTVLHCGLKKGHIKGKAPGTADAVKCHQHQPVFCTFAPDNRGEVDA